MSFLDNFSTFKKYFGNIYSKINFFFINLINQNTKKLLFENKFLLYILEPTKAIC